jgi:DNA gyrase subunit A
MAIRFQESEDIRSSGRFTQGVRGITLDDDDYVDRHRSRCDSNSTIFTVCERGMGKRSDIEDYRLTGRGGKGVINMKITEEVRRDRRRGRGHRSR